MVLHKHSRPCIVVSRCIEFDHCRYNGDIISSKIVERLRAYADFIPVCMEVEIGLGVPRDPVRVVQDDTGRRLVQPATGLDMTDRALAFTADFLDHMSDVDGFIMKSRSPSCGIKDVKVYPAGDRVAALTTKASGFFGREVVKRFGHLAVEDEARLINLQIGDHFLTKLFLLADLRRVAGISELMGFHARNKLLLMYYDQRELSALGNIAANKINRSLSEVLGDYRQHIYKAMRRPPKCGSGINVMLHAFGYMSSELNAEEKATFLDSLGNYREGKVPITVPIGMMRSWIARFDAGYLRQQTFFQPYPDVFLEMMSNDSCIGRDLWAEDR